MTVLESAYGNLIAADTLRIERLLPGPIERVWRYLIDPQLRAQWLAGGDIAPQAGGAVDLLFHNATLSGDDDDPPAAKYCDFNGPMPMHGSVITCEPPHRLAFTWNEPEDPASREPSRVTIELSPQGDRVRLVLVHERLVGRDGMLSVSAGWHTHIDLLAGCLDGQRASGFWRRHAQLEAEYERRLPR